MAPLMDIHSTDIDPRVTPRLLKRMEEWDTFPQYSGFATAHYATQMFPGVSIQDAVDLYERFNAAHSRKRAWQEPRYRKRTNELMTVDIALYRQSIYPLHAAFEHGDTSRGKDRANYVKIGKKENFDAMVLEAPLCVVHCGAKPDTHVAGENELFVDMPFIVLEGREIRASIHRIIETFRAHFAGDPRADARIEAITFVGRFAHIHPSKQRD